MKYGVANAGQGDVWANPSYGDEDTLKALASNPTRYKDALDQGRLIHVALWKTDSTWVKVALSKMMEGHPCGVTVEYNSIRQLSDPDPANR